MNQDYLINEEVKRMKSMMGILNESTKIDPLSVDLTIKNIDRLSSENDMKHRAWEFVKRVWYMKQIPLVITMSYRSFEEQNKLYAQGRTKPGTKVTNAKGGDSFHNYGLAFDCYYLNDDGTPDLENPMTPEIGKIANDLGLDWGGDFANFKDYPHFQISGVSIEDLKKRN